VIATRWRYDACYVFWFDRTHVVAETQETRHCEVSLISQHIVAVYLLCHDHMERVFLFAAEHTVDRMSFCGSTTKCSIIAVVYVSMLLSFPVYVMQVGFRQKIMKLENILSRR